MAVASVGALAIFYQDYTCVYHCYSQASHRHVHQANGQSHVTSNICPNWFNMGNQIEQVPKHEGSHNLGQAQFGLTSPYPFICTTK